MKRQNELADAMRGELMEHAKTFKTSWVYLGQGLYTVWRDKLYYGWGHEKFENYVINELGLKKPLALGSQWHSPGPASKACSGLLTPS